VSFRINLCCGETHFDGYVNIDSYPLPGVDVICDARELRYAEGTVDEVVMFHAIEHFTLDDACMLVRCVFQWLKPGGHLLIEGPDVIKTVKNAPANADDFELVQCIFGDIVELRKNKDGYQHKWGWTGTLMRNELISAGYLVGNIEDGISHPGHEWRDFRVTGFKPKAV